MLYLEKGGNGENIRWKPLRSKNMEAFKLRYRYSDLFLKQGSSFTYIYIPLKI
jgi:hypothetical protein